MLLLGLVVTFNSGSPAAAGTVVDPTPRVAAEQAFRGAIDALDAAPGALHERRTRAAVATAGELLTSYGVAWSLAGGGRDAIVIAPVRGKSRLNSLAWTLRRNVGGLALLFDPRALKEENAGALYDEDAHELLMSSQEIASGTVSDYLAHEILHARNFHALTQGVDNLFMGWIANRETALPFHPTYPHLFSIDELQAYAQQARVNILALDHRKPEADLEGTIEMLESGRQLARAAATTARRAATAIAAVAAAPAGRRTLATTQEIDGVSTRVVGYRAARVAVYFHASPLPERVIRSSPVMRSVVEFDDLTLQLITPAAFRPAQVDAMLGGFLRRTRLLASRSERIAEAFVELQALVEQGEFTLARQRSDALRSLVRRS